MDARFYSIANSTYFLGLVGLINSVRASGHSYPFVVVDTGLTATQRALLDEHAEIVEVRIMCPLFFSRTSACARGRPT